jgi:hypothetical protein
MHIVYKERGRLDAVKSGVMKLFNNAHLHSSGMKHWREGESWMKHLVSRPCFTVAFSWRETPVSSLCQLWAIQKTY